MCDYFEEGPGVTRRVVLGGLVLGALGLVGCQDIAKPIVVDLPDENVEEAPHRLPEAVMEQKVVVPATPLPRDRLQTGMGEVMPRSAWTRVGADTRRVRPMNGVGLITFHHSGDGRGFYADGPMEVAKHLEIVRRFHVSKGFNDIGYHFAIDHAGRVWQLRSLTYEGQHVRIGRDGTRWNMHNVGVVVLGDFNLQQPSAAQEEKIVVVGSYLHRYYKLPATAVKCHRELVETSCPGMALYPYMVAIRKRGL